MGSKCRECDVVLDDDNRASSGNICKKCQSAYAKEYRAKNIDAIRKKAHQWYLKNAEAVIERVGMRHALHREDDNKRRREASYANGTLPMSENRECAPFLGVYVAEEVLCKVFKNVERMPYHNTGYDFRCNNGYLIDSKASCTITKHAKSPRWKFNIAKNQIADYFLFIAFDDRERLNPLYLWLIPGNVVNYKVCASISITTINKWDEYRLDIDKVITCCNSMKDGNI